MDRIRELIACVRSRYPDDNFFSNFEMKCQNNLIRKYYNTYNKALMAVDDESWQILKKKALRHFLNHREGQKKQGFLNILNEAFAYKYLLSKGFENVRFVKEERNRSNSDITIRFKNDQKYCEVRSLGISNDEINKRRNIFSIHNNTDYEKLSEGFLNKFSDAVNAANQQISNFETKALIYIFISFDDFTFDHYQTYRRQLIKVSKDHRFENLFIKMGLFGNRRIFIRERSSFPKTKP